MEMGRRGCGEEDGKVPSTSERMRALDALRGCEGRGATRVCTKDASRNAEGRGPDPPLSSAMRLCGSPRPLPKWSIARECCHGDGLSGGASQHRPVTHICAAPLPLSSLPSLFIRKWKAALERCHLEAGTCRQKGTGGYSPSQNPFSFSTKRRKELGAWGGSGEAWEPARASALAAAGS